MALSVFLLLLILGVFYSTGALKKHSTDSVRINKRSNETRIGNPDDKYKISVVTWNLAEKSPSKEDCSFLKKFKNDDIVVIGAQECEDVRPRREEGHRSRAWKLLQSAALGKSFSCLAQHRMGGLQISVYVKKSVVSIIQGTQILDVACGVGNVLTNKGAVCVLMRIKGKTLALINAHLAAHVGKTKERNADYSRIMTSITGRAQPRWLNKLAAEQNKKKNSIMRKQLSGMSASSRASELGQELKRQYQPWLDQIWKVRGSKKWKSYGEKKAGIPLARIEFVKDKKAASKKGQPNVGAGKRNGGGATVGKGKGGGSSIDRSDQKADSKQPKTVIAKLKASKIDRNPLSGAALRKRMDRKNAAAEKGKKSKVTEIEELPCPFDSLIFLGDLNYRLDLPRLEIELFKESLQGEDFSTQVDALEGILEYDQLTRERVAGRAFQGYSEGPILFPPTFKYDKGSDQFDSSSKARPPAWTDRVLYNVAVRSTDTQVQDPSQSSENLEGAARSKQKSAQSGSAPTQHLKLEKYYSADSRHSDHRPVCAEFTYSV